MNNERYKQVSMFFVGELMHEQLFIVTGASGAGKTSIVDALVAAGIGKRVITCTTRAPRTNNGILEVDGVDYRFFSMEDFTAKLAQGEFAEHANVYGKLYGTRKEDVALTMQASGNAFAVVDIQGAETLMRVYPAAKSVFISVPKEDMQKRLTERGESPDSIALRLAEFDTEEQKADLCHVMLKNEHGRLDHAIAAFKYIIAKLAP